MTMMLPFCGSASLRDSATSSQASWSLQCRQWQPTGQCRGGAFRCTTSQMSVPASCMHQFKPHFALLFVLLDIATAKHLEWQAATSSTGGAKEWLPIGVLLRQLLALRTGHRELVRMQG